MLRVNQQLRLIKWWLILVVFTLGASRQPSIAEKIWTNIGLVNYNKIHERLLFEETAFTEQVIKTESLLWYLLNNGHLDSVTVVRQALGSMLISQNRHNEAVQILDTSNLELVNILILQGDYARSISLHAQALNWYYKAVNVDPDQKEIWHEIGLLHQALGQSDKAIQSLQRSWARHYPNSAGPLAELLRSEGRCDDAIDVWQEALSTNSESFYRFSWWRGLSNCLRATKKWDEAVSVTRLAINEFPDDAYLHLERGYALFALDKNSCEAIGEFQQAIAISENMAVAYAALGDVAAARGNYAESIDWYDEAIKLDSSNPSWYISRADAALSQGDLAQALRFFEESIDAFPQSAYAHYRIALVYRRDEQPTKAVESIEQAIKLLDRPNFQYFLRAAIIYEWVGDNEKAIEAYHQVLIIEPDNERAQERIAELID